MGKKRKADGRGSYSGASKEPSMSDSKLRVNTFEDVANSEDEFHINQDKVFLEEGPAQKRRRKAREDDEFLEFSEEEVLSASPSFGDSEDLEENDEQQIEGLRARVKPTKIAKLAPIESDSGASQAQSDDDDLGGWGTSKKDYYNADLIETEADALEEEAEARRLQQKQLQGMTEADFGFDETEWHEAGKEGEDGQKDEREAQHGVVSEVLPQQVITDSMSPDERLKILRTRYPEFEPLAKEFLDLQSLHEDLSLAARTALETQKSLQSNGSGFQDKLPVAAIKHSALSAYFAALCMYFALLTSSSTSSRGKAIAMSPTELRDHPIMDTLVQCRDLWGKTKDLVIPEPITLSASVPESSEKKADAALVPDGTRAAATARKPRKRKSKAEHVAALAQEEANARRVQRLRETEASLASLSDLIKPASKPMKITPRAPASNGNDSDFGDPTHLDTHEASQKAERKKSLKFYTSQIASKSQKRGTAGRDAGGDADIPYKERLKDRQERLNAQAEKRGKKSTKPTAEEALGGASDEDDARAAAEIRDDIGIEEDYYDLVAAKTSAKKAAKTRLALDQAAAANSLVRIPDEELDREDGKRAISYSIEKNKGLHSKRKKEVRNPRVKKRKKFEDKKKKLGSIRPVYKGGEGKGYQGELTGIKGGLVRSVKL